MPKKTLTASQMLALQVSERTMSCMSLIGSLFIMGTFLRWHYFRKPINRLVFYASFGNVLTNVATLISTSAIPKAAHHFSNLCEFQGILIQWFMMADSIWVFCMAFNVMLVFFFNYNSHQLRLLEKWYLLFSYGLPSLPALVYVVLDHSRPQRIIGPATIWCWVSKDFDWMRIAFFYGPVWIFIICTMMIYIVTGRKIFMKRAQLRSFSRQAGDAPPILTNPFTAANINNIERKTEVQVVTETIDSDCTFVPPTGGTPSRDSFSSTRNLSVNVQMPAPTAGASSRFSRVNWGHSPRALVEVQQPQEQIPNSTYTVTVSADNQVTDEELGAPQAISTSQAPPHIRRTVAMEGNTAAWGYFKVAFLMFAALFIVWVPSTINRVQQFVDKDHAIFGLNLASALVLPLQGFWNAMVYMSTTWPECKRAIAEVMDRSRSARHSEPRPAPRRKESERSLTTKEHQYFEGEIPLSEMLNDGPPTPGLYTRASSTETMKASLSSQHEKR
ncbi:uncharacterized protein BDR25DRAFT_65175 [Lindgomyces ingoldianus]|uniref:Uncharacterized protein n=1 Tax=Lindgomyces ingoldianus TaxID=673940 RepID=A0ACB6RCX2_9PLEO|nr:uncharacterized protein BDR25DRAFT_65175 [Lindgomyces ingoldianus]KAF2476316.1 hypothetical protein BDR25DRAFT_65175 [Lindgomyces ingoldianus]